MDYREIPAFCINLKQHQQKWENSYKSLAKNGFKNIIRIEGIYGKELSQEYIEQNVSVYARFLLQTDQNRCSNYDMPSIGAIGCTLSHKNCWEIIVNENLKDGFIFEDDLDIRSNFIREIQKYLSNLDKNVDVFSFGYLTKTNCKNNKCDRFTGTQGYYITNKGARKLLQYTTPIENPADVYIGLMNKLGHINLVFSHTPLVHQNNITGSSIGLKWYTNLRCGIPHNIYIFILYTFIIIVLTCIIKEKIKLLFR